MKQLRLALVAALFAATLYGQTALATITGSVNDPSGAVLSDAPVTVRNLENGQVFTSASSTTGNYTVSQLPIGDYDLTVAVSGFKTYTHTKFHLAAAQIMREDITLEVGQTTESVTVTAEASLLKTESTEVSQNVTLSQLNNLPILAVAATGSGFRDPFVATRLVPGIRYGNGSNSASGTPGVTTTMSINGTPANTYGTRLDGMTMNPTGPRLISAVMQTQPSVDAIEEVAIQTSNFAAEFGAAGGAMINMVTKSGTNQYHGSAYDYGTNEALNAHQPYTGLRSKIRQHDYGVTFGGPLRIPKVYNGTNKTFFFFSMEIFKQTNLVNGNSSVPIAPYRLGDFSSLLTAENRLITTATGNAVDSLGRTMQSGTIFDPTTRRPVAGKNDVRDPFLDNKIPVSSFDPIAVKVLALVPNPQGVNFAQGLVSNNYTGTFDTSRTSKVPSIKLDQNLGSKGRLSFYLQETNTHSPTSTSGADPLPNLISGGNTTFSSGTTVRLNYDYTITPRLLFHIGIGWNDSDFRLRGKQEPYDSFKELGLKGALVPINFPRIVTAVNGNAQIGGMSSLGQTGATASFERRPSGTASASYVTGKHTYKFGVDYRIEKFPNIIDGGANGTYAFGANMTEQPSLQGITTNQGFDGYEFASFLLGGLSASGTTNVGLTAPINLSNNKSQTGIYAQDTWKVTRKLTVDYGLRWDLGTYAAESYGRNGSIGLAVPNPSASGRLGGMQFEQVCKCNFAKNYAYAYGPRLGVAYQINAKTVFRAGIGVVYNATATASGSSTATATAAALPGNSGQINGLFKDGMPASVVAVWPSFNAGVGHPDGGVIGMPQLLDQNAGRPGRLLQWNIALQREINRNLVVDASYVGNRGAWWTANGLAPLNSISEATLRRYGFNDFTSTADAALLNLLVSALPTNTAARTNLANRGITGFPYASFPTGQTVRQSLRDYPQYNNANLTGAPLGNTWYDSFQLSVTQRFTRGLSLNMNYNFSKNLDLMSATDVFNRANGKSYSNNDRPHSLRLTAQYVVPKVFSGMRFVSYALSDWGLGTYLQYESAGVLARPSSNGTLPLSQFLGRGPGSAQLKKDADGNYMNPWSVDWVDNSGTHRTDPIDINCHCFDPTKTVALNKDAWENVPNGQWAADQSDLRFFRGIRTPTENANFSRNFRLKERVSLNVRVEFNNIFNRMQLVGINGLGAGPSVAGNFNATPQKFGLDVNGNRTASTGLYSGGFGTFGVLNGLGNQRTGTFVARLTF